MMGVGAFRLRGAGRLAVALVMTGVVGMATAAAASADGAQAGNLRFRSAPKVRQSSNLVDHGGRITPASHTYAIFWGPQSAWSSDVFSGIGSLFGGMGGSSYLGIAQQYMRGATITSSYGGVKYDASAPPRKVAASTLAAEVGRVYGATLDPNGIYFVYTSNFPSGGNYCAWHSFATSNGQNVAVAYMPNLTGIAGCQTGNTFNLTGQSATLSALANVTAHEFMEAVTDTWPGSGTYGWIDGSGQEIGDKCAWQFSGPVTLSNGSTWQLQEEWSNAITGCAQG